MLGRGVALAVIGFASLASAYGGAVLFAKYSAVFGIEGMFSVLIGVLVGGYIGGATVGFMPHFYRTIRWRSVLVSFAAGLRKNAIGWADQFNILSPNYFLWRWFR